MKEKCSLFLKKYCHKLVYKYWDAEVGKELYKKYRSGVIGTEEDFKDEMNRLTRYKDSREG